MGFVFARRARARAVRRATRTSLALDLHDQWAYMEKTTQWRFTPPTHVVVALDAALDAVRRRRRAAGAARALHAQLRDAGATAWRELGFRPFLDPRIQAPIIVTFHAPADPRYTFQRVLRPRARQGLHPVSGQADAGRDVSRRLHRRDRTATKCATRSTPCATRSPSMGIDRVAPVAAKRVAA